MDTNRLFIPSKNCGKNCKRLRRWKNTQAYFQGSAELWAYDEFGYTMDSETLASKEAANEERQSILKEGLI